MSKIKCACGCGTLIDEFVNYRRRYYAKNHQNIGKKRTENSRLKMSLSAKKNGSLPPWIKERKNNNYKSSVQYRIWVEKVMLKNNGNCIMCNNKANQAHHIKDRVKYPNLIYNIENGMPLCRSCHLKIHNPLQYRWGIK